jgi:hypothetical protein
VFRVLSALCRLLDDITWPTEDIELVSLLLTVLEHCTNSKRLRKYFVPKAQLQLQLQLKEHDSCSEHYTQKPNSAGHVQQKEQQQQVRVAAAAPAPAGEPVVVASSVAPAAASSGSSSHLHHQQQQVQALQSSIQSMTRPVILQELAERTPGSTSAFNASAAAAGPASPGQRPMGRKSGDLLRRTPSGNSMPGVAYTRLAPAASPPMSPAHNAAAAAAPHQLSPQAGSAATSGHTSAGGAHSAAAAMKAAAEDHSDEGCALDPAAQVVAEQPVAPIAAQSVLGSRKALRGVTAQQLLAEPIVQILLRKVE